MKRWAIYNEGNLLYDDYYANTKSEALEQFREDIDEDLEPGVTAREVVEDEETGRLVHKRNPGGLAKTIVIGVVVTVASTLLLRRLFPKVSAEPPSSPTVPQPPAPGHTTT